jgi:hypothetical protein
MRQSGRELMDNLFTIIVDMYFLTVVLDETGSKYLFSCPNFN